MITKEMNKTRMMEIWIDELTKGMRLPRTWSGYVVMPVPPPRQLNKEGPSPGNLKRQVPLSRSLDLGDPNQGSKRGGGIPVVHWGTCRRRGPRGYAREDQGPLGHQSKMERKRTGPRAPGRKLD